MGERSIKKVLQDFGLTELEAEIYLFLARHDPLKGTEIAKEIKKDKAQVYHILRSLQNKGLVESTLEAPVRFAPVPFEYVVESAIKAKKDEAARIENAKQELLEYWKNTNKTKIDLSLEKFVVIQGRTKVYSKIAQMISNTKRQLLSVSSVAGLLRADQFGLLDIASKHPSKNKIQFRFLTELSTQNLNSMKLILNKATKKGFDLRGRNPDLGLPLFPQMVIRDNEETIFFTTEYMEDSLTTNQDEVCLWTNCKSLVQAFTAVFEDSWRNSTEIHQKIAEVEKGTPSTQTVLLQDPEKALRKYEQVTSSAEKEILMITSSDGLAKFSESPLLEEWKKKGISIKIMAPLIGNNMEATKEISSCCEVRHIQTGYLGTTIVDEKHLFQFKNPPPNREKPLKSQNFDKIFYTNDLEYIEKTKTMLNYLWKNAQPPSIITLESVASATIASGSEHVVYEATKKMVGHTVTEIKDSSKQLTEQSVIEKIIHSKKYKSGPGSKGIVKMYGTNCQAIIHPPSYMNLPNMLIHTYHMEKNSTYGVEDAMLIHLWLNTPGGFFYVLSAAVTDNPDAVDFWKKACAGTPAEQNVYLVRKDELHARIYGNSLFEGWTVPMRLSPQYILPPACLLIEGFGEIKTNAYEATLPSGYNLKTEGNILEAFVTFLHPSSKYSGPGTDGAFGRDIIMELYPPKSNKKQNPAPKRE